MYIPDEVYECPLCHKPLMRYAKKKDPNSYFWGCSGFRDGCNFIADDFDGEPYIKLCPECGGALSRKISTKTGKPFVACFNKEGHESKKVLFFNDDGSKKDSSDYPKSKADFYCPECSSLLLYRRVRNGKYAGLKNVFLCNQSDKHKDGKVHFFEDNDGTPVMS